MSALEKTFYVQANARKVGFDWRDRREVWDKVKEELDEVIVEVDKLDEDKMEEEFGDLLFSILNAALLYNIDPMKALERCNRKFISRFSHIEDKADQLGKKVEEMTLEEMDNYWNEAKAIERGLIK